MLHNTVDPIRAAPMEAESTQSPPSATTPISPPLISLPGSPPSVFNFNIQNMNVILSPQAGAQLTILPELGSQSALLPSMTLPQAEPSEHRPRRTRNPTLDAMPSRQAKTKTSTKGRVLKPSKLKLHVSDSGKESSKKETKKSTKPKRIIIKSNHTELLPTSQEPVVTLNLTEEEEKKMPEPAAMATEKEKGSRKRKMDENSKGLDSREISKQTKEEKTEPVIEMSEKEFIAKIKANFHLSLAERLNNVLGNAYHVSSQTYQLIINCENEKDPAKPFKVFMQMEGLSKFRETKKDRAGHYVYGDYKSQSWIFTNESKFAYFLPGYLPSEPSPGVSKYYEFRMWQLNAANNYKILVNKDEKEIARGWASSDSSIAERHTIAKTSPEENKNPIPGAVPVRLSDLMCTLFKSKRKFWADSSYKKKGILLRLWEALKTGKNYYQQQSELKPNPIVPEKVMLAEHKTEVWVEQDAHIFDKSLKKLQNYPLANFYNILDHDQRKSLINIYNNSIGKKLNKLLNIPQKRRSKDEENPFSSIECNLQQLVIAVDEMVSKNKESQDDVALHALICDGIDILKDNTYTKPFTLGTPLAQFKQWVFDVVWRGYYWESRPDEEKLRGLEAESKAASLPGFGS